MLSKIRMPVHSPAAGVIPDPVTGRASNLSPVWRKPSVVRAQSTGQAATGAETRAGRFRRKARRTRLHGSAIATVALVAYLIALAATNTAHVKVNWVFGSSRVSLVWLVLFAAILGWLLGLVATAAFHWRTRRPRRRGGASS
jgi:uncharacterized integral membrane protein